MNDPTDAGTATGAEPDVVAADGAQSGREGSADEDGSDSDSDSDGDGDGDSNVEDETDEDADESDDEDSGDYESDSLDAADARGASAGEGGW